jgi:hypothetical protein
MKSVYYILIVMIAYFVIMGSVHESTHAAIALSYGCDYEVNYFAGFGKIAFNSDCPVDTPLLYGQSQDFVDAVGYTLIALGSFIVLFLSALVFKDKED